MIVVVALGIGVGLVVAAGFILRWLGGTQAYIAEPGAGLLIDPARDLRKQLKEFKALERLWKLSD